MNCRDSYQDRIGEDEDMQLDDLDETQPISNESTKITSEYYRRTNNKNNATIELIPVTSLDDVEQSRIRIDNESSKFQNSRE